jgi:hypothetical protein
VQALDPAQQDQDAASRSRATILHEIEHLGRIVDDLLHVNGRMPRIRVGVRAPSGPPSRPAC